MLDATEDNLADARRVCRVIRARAAQHRTDGRPGISARAIADELNAGGSMFDRAFDDRLVRRLIELARVELGVPIVAEPGLDGGYRLPADARDVEVYLDQCRVMLRRYARLIAITRGRADLVAGEQLPLEAIAAMGMDEEAWADVQRHVAQVLG